MYNDDGQLTSQSTLKQDPIFGWQDESIVNYTMDAASVLRSYTVPAPTAPKKKGCEVLRQIIVIVVMRTPSMSAGDSV